MRLDLAVAQKFGLSRRVAREAVRSGRIDVDGVACDEPGRETATRASLNFHRVDLRWERPVAGWQFLARSAFGTDDARSQLYSSPIRVRAYGVSPRLALSRTLFGAAFEMGVDVSRRSSLPSCRMT